MAAGNDTASMALFCDFENIALGVRDAQYEKFDIRPVLERLLAKGSIVVKKAYCDWERYKGFKAAMHEANFELIEIPHVRQSGKNSADIRMVVDALDLCYTKAHVDTFVIISGDSDFSPLVSKLRENAKKVIGVGVKQSCSDLLVTNCDEFIYYDDLVREREAQRVALRRERDQGPGKRSPEEEQKRREKLEERKHRAVELVAATFADMIADRGDNERIWASVLKEVIKRRNPGFNESYFGFRSFGNLLDEAAQRGLLSVGRDDKSGNYVTRAQPRASEGEHEARSEEEALPAAGSVDAELPEAVMAEPQAAEQPAGSAPVENGGRRRGRGRGRKAEPAASVPGAQDEAPAGEATQPETPMTLPEATPAAEPAGAVEKPARPKRSRQPARKEKASASPAEAPAPQPAGETPSAEPAAVSASPEPAAGRRRGRRKAASGEEAPVALAGAVPVEAAPVADETEPAARPSRRRTARSRKAALEEGALAERKEGD